ncbi:hypothetical protein BH09PLA1_BH09PLA1_06820 [soil metagenome]
MPEPLSIDAILLLDEEHLIRLCKFEAYKSGGPGGQKRNKTSSAVKWTHIASGIHAHSNDFRLQSENRLRALHRLRFKLATDIRTPIVLQGYEPPAWVDASKVSGKFTTNTRNPIYARLAAHVLDVFAALEGRLAETATLLGVANSNLSHFLQAEHTVWAAAARIRAANNLPSLSSKR